MVSSEESFAAGGSISVRRPRERVRCDFEMGSRRRGGGMTFDYWRRCGRRALFEVLIPLGVDADTKKPQFRRVRACGQCAEPHVKLGAIRRAKPSSSRSRQTGTEAPKPEAG